MFCEKCGNQLPEGSKFCDKCGTPIAAPIQQPEQQPVQPQPAAPVEEEAPTESLYQYNFKQEASQQQGAPNQDFQPAQQQGAPNQEFQPAQQQGIYPQQYQQAVMPYGQTAAKAPKQPMSDKTKKLILFGGIGAGVLVIILIALFAFIIPAFNKVDAIKYVDVSFSNSDSTVYNGEIRGSASVSASDIYIDKLGDAETKKLAENQSKLEKLASGDYSYEDLLKDSQAVTKASAVSNIVNKLEVDCKIKGQEVKKDSSSSSDSSSSVFENAKNTDTLIVTVKWPKEPIKIKEIEQQEALAGLSFDKTDKSIEIKLEDELKSSKLNIVEKTEFDFVKYINDKNLIKINGTPDYYPKAYLGEFEYKLGQYTFSNKSTEKDSYHNYNKVVVTDSKDTSKDISFYVNFDSVESAVENDEIEYEINSGTEHIYNTDVFITNTEGKFKYKPNHALTLDEAKKNSEKISEAIKANISTIDTSIKDSSRFSVEEIYYCVENDEPDDENAKLYIFYKNTATGKYKYITATHTYLADDTFFYGSASDSWSSYSSLADSKQYVSPFYKYSKDDYTTTKVY